MDKITEILKQMHDMADEPVRMQEGGTVLTPEDYQSQYVDFYSPFSIDVQQAPEVEEEEDDDEPLRPNILTPVSERESTPFNPLAQTSLMTGTTTFSGEYVDPVDYINNFGKNENTKNLSDKGFDKYLQQSADALKKSGGLPVAVASMASGIPMTGFAYAAGQLNRKRQLENAQKIAETGRDPSGGYTGGFMFTYNGQTISRAPGSRLYEGTLGNVSQSQFAALEAIGNNFIPGTMREEEVPAGYMSGGYKKTGKEALYAGDTFAIDAYGNLHSASGIQGGRAFEAEAARQGFMRQELDRLGMSGTNFTDAQARQFIQEFRSAAGAGRPFVGTVRGMSDAQYADKVTASSKLIENILGGMGFTKESNEEAPATSTPQTVIQAQEQESGDDSTPAGTPTQYSVQDIEGDIMKSFGGSEDAADYSFDFDSPAPSRSAPNPFSDRGRFDGPFAEGGRVGMQAGGVAAQPAGFVEGPPENFTEKQTVADDRPMSVPEGTFVINAAAVEFAGSDDIKKMLSDAYGKMQKKVDKTISVAKIPTEDEIDVAVSRGEVIVPPEVAKIIGYDRLEKINNRGKKEVSRRQKNAAGGGLLAGKKFASGGEILPTPKPKKEALADVELRADLEEFIRDDQLARLGWDLYTSGDLKLVGLPMRRGVRAYTAAGMYLPEEGRDTFPEFPSGVGYSEEQESQREKVGGAESLQGTFIDTMFKGVGKVLDPQVPTAMYFAEPMGIHPKNRTTDAPKNDRAQVMITLAHELRHAAINHLVFDYGAPQMTLGGEEVLMDYFDDKARRTASKKSALVSEIPLTKGRKQRYEAARYSSYNKEKYELYNKLATEVLKVRGVPPRAKPEEKGWLQKTIDTLFN